MSPTHTHKHTHTHTHTPAKFRIDDEVTRCHRKQVRGGDGDDRFNRAQLYSKTRARISKAVADPAGQPGHTPMGHAPQRKRTKSVVTRLTRGGFTIGSRDFSPDPVVGLQHSADPKLD